MPRIPRETHLDPVDGIDDVLEAAGSPRLPPGRRQLGTSTIGSPGRNIAVTLHRPAARRNSTVASDRSAPEPRPYSRSPFPTRHK
ncbi:hypothetical protein ACFYXF_25790 [Streptomyces sp. NPDC002680]|uniref:hypothetical protein n=1 Tax=Streptomyces sp. NPDC002680 TaxID=3364659 RepID=UPI0036B94E72